jgi:TonB family protein
MIHRFAIWLLLGTACISLAAPYASSQAVPQRVRVSSGVESGLLVSKVDPIYPPLARQAHIQGTVILKVVISNDGDVKDIQLFSGHPMLAPAAIEAVKQWKYKPYLLNGEPVEVDTQVQVNFTLSDKPPAENMAGDQNGSAPPAANPGSDNYAVPQRVRVSKGVMQGLLVSKVDPTYPSDAKEQRIQGVVVLQVAINKEGNVSDVQLISGHPLLAPAAIEAVKQWKYKPYLLNGEPLEVDTQVQVSFRLKE